MSNDAWYIDNGTSCHMTGVYEIFTSLAERDMRLDIELGDNTNYNAAGLGTIAFRKGLDDLLEVKDVLYVPGLKKNLLSISQIEDKGMVVTFVGGRVLIYPRGASSDCTKVIGVRQENLYRFQYLQLRH